MPKLIESTCASRMAEYIQILMPVGKQPSLLGSLARMGSRWAGTTLISLLIAQDPAWSESPGTVMTWGVTDDRGRPAALSAEPQDLISVASGGFYDNFTIVLRADGTVGAWGVNDRGQTAVPGTLTDVLSIAAGGFHGVALKSNGRVVVWGSRGDPSMQPPSSLRNAIAIASGHSFVLALKSTGSVVEWGSEPVGIANQSSGRRIRAIAAGGGFGMALAEGDSVILGTFWLDGSQSPVMTRAPRILPHAVQIAVSDSLGGAVNEDGSVTVWGVPEFETKVQQAGLRDVRSIALGNGVLVAVNRDGTVATVNALGDPRYDPPPDLKDVRSVSLGYLGGAAIGRPTPPELKGEPQHRSLSRWESDSLSADVPGFALRYLWRRRGVALPAETNSTLRLSLANADMAGEYEVVVGNPAGIVTNRVAILEVLPDPKPGTVISWGRWNLNRSGLPVQPALVPDRLTQAVQVSAGSDHDFAVLADGTVRSWGDPLALPLSPAPTGTLGVTSIAAGRNHAVALHWDGSVTGWGTFWDIGGSVVPPGLSGVTALAAGINFSVALKSDGSVVVWGGFEGGLVSLPPGLGVVRAIAASGNLAAFLRNDGTIALWWFNPGGGSWIEAGIHNAIAIAVGYEHLLALKGDHTIQTWDPRRSGASEYADFGQAEIPTNLGEVTSVAASEYYSLALRTDGSVVAWGRSETLSPLASAFPAPPTGLNGVTAIAAGENHALALVGPEAPPPIRIASSTTETAISWPITASGFWPETAEDLRQSDWKPIEGVPVVSDGWRTLHVQRTTSIQYYRVSRR